MTKPAARVVPPVVWGTLKSLGPLTIEPVDPGSNAAALWDQTVRCITLWGSDGDRGGG